MIIKNSFSQFGLFLFRHKQLVFLLVIFIAHIFFRFYLLEERLHFNWDQVDNAWAAKNIIVDHKLPLLGMVAKGNSGFYIGPAYYYLIAIFYWIFDLDPIASGIFAGVTSIFTFFVLFFVIKKLFSYNIALIAVFIHTVSFFIISSDRSQWPVNFIAPVSIVIFYSLYNVLLGKIKYLILLGIGLGLSFHVHFTSIYYLIIILLVLPFFPRKKEMIKYVFFSILVFILLVSPIIIAELTNGNKEANNFGHYFQTYYHGFHLTRVLQLTHDAFVESQLILRGWSRDLNYLFLFAFYIIYLELKPSRNKMIMCYLVSLWFIVPWFVFSTYKGEISNYYFFSTRPIVLMVLAYLSFFLFNLRIIFPKLFIIGFWIYFSYVNVNDFLHEGKSDYKDSREKAIQAVTKGEIIKPYQNIPESYLYYYYTRKNKK